MEQTIEMVGPQIEAIAKDINEWNDMYCLGYGATYAIAMEGALKLKEITYAHCEGMLSTEFKHGPLSAVSKGFPIIFCAGPNDVPLITSGINEVKVRGARTITIGEEDARLRANGDDLVVIPKSDAQISALLGVLPLQLLSYHMSVMRGLDLLRPREIPNGLVKFARLLSLPSILGGSTHNATFTVTKLGKSRCVPFGRKPGHLQTGLACQTPIIFNELDFCRSPELYGQNEIESPI